ncbi:MAG: AtpZ/AtpI family protein [Erysipelotrichaceae bacterium]|nr:AtpZ/AtpI family protein [Erysipelotrichaceae bacterium]
MEKTVYQFLARIIVGLIGGVLLGTYLDNKLNTSPWILIGMIVYVVFGSLYLLVKEASHGK